MFFLLFFRCYAGQVTRKLPMEMALQFKKDKIRANTISDEKMNNFTAKKRFIKILREPTQLVEK